MLLIDDLLLRALGISLGPLDLFYLIDIIGNYARDLYNEENTKNIKKGIKENRLLYELEEISLNEYVIINKDLNNKLKEFEKITKLNLPGRINLL